MLSLAQPTDKYQLKGMTLLEKLVALLDEKGITQESLEVAASLSKNRISKWKNNEGEPTARQALRMARHLDVDPGWFIDDSLGMSERRDRNSQADEQSILTIYRALGLTREAAIRGFALAARGFDVSPTELPPGTARQFPVRDTSEHYARLEREGHKKTRTTERE